MMFAFFSLELEVCLLLVPGSEPATPSDGPAFESGAGELVSEVSVGVDVKGLGVEVLGGGAVRHACLLSLQLVGP
jgi:hypothetical protein